ncbi:efflux RND transporter periplasmic adaptor subunit [candidate division KSB1 bacterium]|nr:efflux RND transporter periplasmic adaptor subunit [candidate division KSB1 bacterium]
MRMLKTIHEWKDWVLLKKDGILKQAKWKLVVGGILLLALIVLLIVLLSGSSNVATTEVMRGEFVIDIKTRGEIDALNSTNISLPRIRRRMSLQIVDMAPEGTIVKKGDFLIQLDQSEMQQSVDESNDDLANAQAQLESEKATMASNMAQLQSQLEQEKYSYEQAELNLKMMEYEAEAKKQEYEIRMRKAEVALSQAKEKIDSQKIIDRATLKKAELSVRQAESELREDERNLSALTITAPINGLVVYQEIHSSTGMKKVQIGDTPWHGMAVMKIPDMSTMMARTTVNEVDIADVQQGNNVIITVEALEGTQYFGHIDRLATLARRENETNIKVFDADAVIDSTDGELRPGMTCELSHHYWKNPGCDLRAASVRFSKRG